MRALIDTKVCRQCGVEKELSAFHPHKGCSKGVRGSCRECVRVRLHGWYADNREAINEKVRINRQALKIEAIKYKGGCCEDCKGVFHPCVMQFHHIEPHTKEANPSFFLRGSFEKAKLELDKCVLLCANCHMVRHHVEDQG